MKELYLNAEMDIVKFAAEDVIATSAAEEEATTWSKRPNETEPDWNTGW
jgi:hypothetical protein